MSASERRVEAVDVAGMDACIRGLRLALDNARDWRGYDDSALALIANEVQAVTAHWVKIRGPLPLDPEEAT